MGSISIETKKLTELGQVTNPKSDDLLPVHDGAGLKTVTLGNLKKQLNGEQLDVTKLNKVISPSSSALLLINDGTDKAITYDNLVKEVKAKPLNELATVTSPVNEDLLPIQNGSDLKAISYGTLKNQIQDGMSSGGLDVFDGAGAHNSIYRGKNLGTSVTAEQYQAISSGTFTDLFIGDYWVMGGVNWRIAAFDYFLNMGDTNCTTHHAVIVPDTNLYNEKMNDSHTTDNGYKGSKMRTSGLNQAINTIKGHFSGHVMSHRILISTAMSNGRPSSGSWVDSEVDLMSERMVYGNPIFSSIADGSNIPYNYQVEHSQLPLFALNHSLISNRGNYWLRDIVSASYFALVGYRGNATYYGAGTSLGVRPAFCIS